MTRDCKGGFRGAEGGRGSQFDDALAVSRLDLSWRCSLGQAQRRQRLAPTSLVLFHLLQDRACS